MQKKLMLSSLLACVLFACGCGPNTKYTVPERRQIINDMAQQTLQKLYQQIPATKEEIAAAAGYGVFSNANVNVLLASAGSGYGVVVDRTNNQKIYMKMGLLGVGPGIGVKDTRQVLIFRDANTLQNFVEKSLEIGGHMDATVKAGEQGGELTEEGNLNDDITIYSMAESGLALQATLTGAKYWKDPDLN